MRRRLILLLGLGLVGFVAAAATLPWWLGLALGWAGASRGLTFARYERIGYARFALHQVEVRYAPVRVTASRAEADTPLLAWWRRGDIAIGTWSVDVTPRPDPPLPSTAPRGWLPLQAILHGVARALAQWTPFVTAGAGTVRWPGGELGCAAARWDRGSLTVRTLAWRGRTADAILTLADDTMRLVGQSPLGRVSCASRGAHVTGNIRIWQQQAALQARFASRGWLPAEATLLAADWRVPGAQLGLGGVYAAVHGQGKIEWRNRRFRAEAALRSDPVSGQPLPPLAVELRGQGDLQAFTLESLDATLPGLSAHLSEAVTVERNGDFRAGDARFAVEADLARLPWFDAQGTGSGHARLTPRPGRPPLVTFELAARQVVAAGVAAKHLAAEGQFAWPRIQINSARLTGADDELLVVRGGWDFVAQEILGGEAEGAVSRANLARWLPAELAFAHATLHASAAGSPQALRHSGAAQIPAVQYRGSNPLGVALTWTGRGPSLDALTAAVTAGRTVVSLAGAADVAALSLTSLELTHDGTSRLRLQAPAQLRWRPELQLTDLHLTGPDARLDAAFAWGATGHFALAVANFPSAWLSDFGAWRGPAWQVAALTATGAWAGGPLTFSLSGRARIDWRPGRSAALAIVAAGDPSGVQISDLSVREAGTSVVRVLGRLPVRISPGVTPWFEFEPAGVLALDATATAQTEFWPELAALTGFELQDPSASAQLTGTWARPAGTLRMRAARVAADPVRYPGAWPTMEGFEVDLAGDSGEVRIERLRMVVEGQALSASGRWPVAAGTWRALVEDPLPHLQRGAEFHLTVPDADVAALARFLPEAVAPKGRLHAEVRYAASAFAGTLQLRDGATRALGPLGVLQEINAELRLTDRTLDLQAVTARLGGQLLTLTGSVAWPEPPPGASTGIGHDADLAGLKFALALKGTNLPFVRQTGALVRGDLDLTLTSPPRGSPRLAGTVHLRQSLFLSDVRSLLPGSARAKARTPPYFTVTRAPFAAWRLDVTVAGERFLRLRTALFNGLASARFQLSGTLGEPSVRGEATLDEGLVKLPFATFVVQEGRVSLTPEQGGEPQVWLVGTVRRLNHDLRLEASGPATAPVLLFTSSPPLESGELLLMVMTGETAREGVAYTDRQRMARLGTFLGQSLVASFGGDSEAGERLSLSTGENVSRQGRETYGIEYRLSERWSLVGEYDEFDQLNAGVKWRVFSRGGTREEKKP